MYTTFENNYSQLGPYANTILQNWASTISSEGDPNYYANCAKSDATSTSASGSSSSNSSYYATALLGMLKKYSILLRSRIDLVQTLCYPGVGNRHLR